MQVIKINPKDNVVTCIIEEGLAENSKIPEFHLSTQSKIPFGHKIALEDIPQNNPIIRYGTTIGFAKEDIAKGGLVDFHNVLTTTSSKLDDLLDIPFAIQDSGYQIPDLSDRTFMGYVNSNGTVGTKNILAIHTTVQCVAGVVNRAVDYLRHNVLINYPEVEDIVAINHSYGCGVAINSDSSYVPQAIISNIAKNPNLVEESIAIGLGCEKFTMTRAFEHIPPENQIILQEEEGFEAMLEKIVSLAEKKLDILNKRQRQACPLDQLRLGVQCGGSDSFSGISANNVIGYAIDAFAKAGAKVGFSEITEVRDGSQKLIERMKDPDLRRKFVDIVSWYDHYLESDHVDRSANPTPGNLEGGLINIVDKAMGSINKSGFSEIKDVVAFDEIIHTPGVNFIATSASDFVCGTSQLAAGVTLQVFSTGRGTPYNLREYPVIKLSTNQKLGHHWKDLIDLDCGDLLTGSRSLEDLGTDLINLIIDVASGKTKTKADYYHLFNDLVVFNPAPIT